MPEELRTQPMFLLIVGLAMVLSNLLKVVLERLRLPPLLGYLLLGLLLRVADDQYELLTHEAEWSLEFLAQVGVICLLFRVGLDSNPWGLLHELPRTIPIFLGNVLLSGALGYAAARHLLGLQLIPSLVAATALTATSVAVSVVVWQEADALHTPEGTQLVGVAELDDVAAVCLMLLLFAVIPVVTEGGDRELLKQVLLLKGGWLLAKGLTFGTLCYLFARLGERRLTRLVLKFEKPPGPAVAVAGVSVLIASLAGWLGFSVAVGALFAGLVFSRDPSIVRLEADFSTIYHLFTPFFFLGIGLQLDLGALTTALGWGSVLLVVAVLGKVVGAAIPALLVGDSRQSALLLGLSMIPRAEIALFIVATARKQGKVPEELYGGMVLVCAVTCLGVPPLLRRQLQRWRPDAEPTEAAPDP